MKMGMDWWRECRWYPCGISISLLVLCGGLACLLYRRDIFFYSALSYRLYRERLPKAWDQFLGFVVRGVLHHGAATRETFVQLQSNTFRQQLVQHHPLVLQWPVKPYFFYRATPEDRAQIVADSLRFIETRLTLQARETIFLTEQGLPLWQEAFRKSPGAPLQLSLSLVFGGGYSKEGCFTWMLRLHSAEGAIFPVYNLTFWVEQLPGGGWRATIGALQGPIAHRHFDAMLTQMGFPDRLELVRAMTHHGYGVRPRSLLILVMQQFAHQFGIEALRAVSGNGVYVRNMWYRRNPVQAPLDDIWLEAQGQLSPDPRFYDLPLQSAQRPLEEIESKKRAQYRRRYAWLAEKDQEADPVWQQIRA